MNLQCEPYKANARGWTRCNLMNVSSWTKKYRLKLILKSAHGKKSNATLLAGIYLCLKNIVSYISQSPPLGKFIQCKYTSWVLPLNHCYVGMPKIGAFCVEPRSSQDVSTDVTKGLHPAPSPIHNSKQTWAQLLFQEIFTWLVFLQHRVSHSTVQIDIFCYWDSHDLNLQRKLLLIGVAKAQQGPIILKHTLDDLSTLKYTLDNLIKLKYTLDW